MNAMNHASAAAEIINANIDRQVKQFLDERNLPMDREAIAKRGYHLVIESRGEFPGKKHYTVKLYRLEAGTEFTIDLSLKVDDYIPAVHRGA